MRPPRRRDDLGRFECTSCGEFKSLSSFPTTYWSPDVPNGFCYTCRSARQKKYNARAKSRNAYMTFLNWDPREMTDQEFQDWLSQKKLPWHPNYAPR